MNIRLLVLVILLALVAVSAWLVRAWMTDEAGSAAELSAPVTLPSRARPTAAGQIVVTQQAPTRAGLAPASSVYLDQHELADGGPFGLLGRELVRQALLNVARDDFGADTRDAALGEKPMSGSSRAFVVHLRGSGQLHVSISDAATAAKPTTLLSAEMAYSRPGTSTAERIDDYLELVTALDTSGRRAFTELLQTQAIAKRPATAAPLHELPRAVTADLAAMSAFRQCAALRALHELARQGGEQPLITGALARGYANASLLTHHLWRDTSLVFAARALLYAERTVAESHASPWSLRQRAYARILVGFVAQGCADLDLADRGAAGASPEPTPWVDTLRHFAAFDRAALERDATAGNQLAALLRLLSTAHAQDWELVYADAYAALEVAKTCFRAVDLLSECGGVSNLHRVTAYAPAAMQVALTDEIGHARDLPSSVRDAIADGAELDQRPAIVAALRQSAETPCGEPSWAAIAQIVDDETLLHAYRRLDFMVNRWAVPPEDGIAQYSAAIADHPYRNVVLAYGVDVDQEPERIRAMLGEVHFSDFRPDMHAMLVRLNQVDHDAACRIWDPCVHRSDPTLWDLAWETCLTNTAKDLHARRLDAVASHSPLAALMRIGDEHSPPDAKALDAYRRDFAGHPSVRSAIADLLMKQKQWAAAATELEAVVALSPDKSAFERLASCRYAQGDEAGWVASLQRYLAADDEGGLGHADVQVKLAYYYMNRREYATAWPYAQTAAETWAAWAMECAADCAEGLGDLATAEQWWQRDAERYPDQALRWFEFTVRTGRGRSAAARSAALERVATLRRSSQPEEIFEAGLVADELGDTRLAKELYAKSFAREANPLAGLLLALLAWQADDLQTARDALARVTRDGRTFAYDGKVVTEQVALAELLASVLATTPVKTLDAVKLQQALDACDTSVAQDVNLAYCIGRALDVSGDRAAALPFYRHAVTTEAIQKHTHVLAAKRLRELGEDPWPVHQAIFKPKSSDGSGGEKKPASAGATDPALEAVP